MNSSTPTPAVRSAAWRAGFAILLASGMAAGTVIVQVSGVLAPFLLDDLGLTRSRLGLLVTAVAGVGALASPVAGGVADRLGGRRVLAGTFAVSAAGLAILALAPSFAWAMVAVVVAGLANAACNPATNKLLAVHLPPGQRGLIMGVKQSGVQGGYFLAGALLPSAALIVGWRSAVGIFATVAISAVLATFWLLPDDVPGAPTPTEEPGTYRHAPAMRWLAAYAFLMGAGVAPVITYLPLYSHESVGLSVAAAGAVAAFAGLVGIPARILWSGLAERGGRFAASLAHIALLSIASTLAIWGAAFLGAPVLWLGAFGAGVSLLAWNAVGMLAVVAEAEIHHAGRASGLVLFGFLAGYTVTPALFGASVDLTGSYGPGWVGVTILFAAALGVAWAWRITY